MKRNEHAQDQIIFRPDIVCGLQICEELRARMNFVEIGLPSEKMQIFPLKQSELLGCCFSVHCSYARGS